MKEKQLVENCGYKLLKKFTWHGSANNFENGYKLPEPKPSQPKTNVVKAKEGLKKAQEAVRKAHGSQVPMTILRWLILG